MSLLDDAALKQANRRLVWNIFIGRLLVVLLVLGIGGWAATTRLDSALVTSGRVVLEGNQKEIQHEDGGTLAEIFVDEGQRVARGDLLLRLEDQDLRDRRAMFERTATDLFVNIMRLQAERDGADSVTIPDALPDGIPVPPDLVTPQMRLFDARMKAHRDTVSQLQERIAQNDALVAGLIAQKTARESEAQVVAEQLATQEQLVDRGSVARQTLIPIRREKFNLEGDVARLVSEIARARSVGSELRLQLTEERENRLAQILDELNQRDATMIEALQNRASVDTKLNARTLHAPVAGRVLELKVFTVGGVLAPGETAMYIVPDDARPIIEARIAPGDIDLVSLGQRSELKFSAYDQDDLDKIFGQVTTVSADVVTDDQTGEDFYTLQISLPEDEAAKLGDRPVLPGMPVEVFLLNPPKTVLEYLLEPLSNQINRAFREV